MKPNQFKSGSFLLKSLLGLALVSLMTLSSAHATLLFSGVDLGTAGRTHQWAVFALSGGITDTDTVSQTGISGDIGAASGSNITLSGSAKVAGDAYIRSGGVLRKSGSASISGSVNTADTFVSQVYSDAVSAASQANALATSVSGASFNGWNSLTTVNQNTNLSLSAPDGARVVLHLTDFVLTGGATFTLSGTANTTYIIDVANNFSLTGGHIALSGGIDYTDILFNVVGSGSDVALASASQFQGTLLATNRNVNLSAGSSVSGEIVAGKVAISGGSTITRPPTTSP